MRGSQFSLLHKLNKKLTKKTKNNIDQHEISQTVQKSVNAVGTSGLSCKRFVEQVNFKPGIKELRTDEW